MKDNFYGYYSNVFMTKMRLMVKVVVLPHVVLARLLFYFMTLYDMCGGVVAGVHSSLAFFKLQKGNGSLKLTMGTDL